MAHNKRGLTTSALSNLRFIVALWRTNLLSAMEYRAAFIAQAAGMFLNNAFYFVFWVLFFDRFEQVRGWQLEDMVLLFAVVACSFGLAAYLFGNAFRLAELVAEGKLDYYLALPRPVLGHVLASRSIASGLGDVTYGLVSFLVIGAFSPESILRFVAATALSMVVLLSFLVLVQSFVFWLGGAAQLGQQAVNAMVTLAIYPVTLFDGSAKLIIFFVLPAAFVGAVPAQFVRSPSWSALAQMLFAGAVLLVLSLFVFHRGLRRYESGSALQVQV